MFARAAGNNKLILAAMIFAVAMTFIDQTIVAIAIPQLQDDLTISATGLQWIVNGYLLSLAALFAFGGRLSDVVGRRRMLVIGVLIFATASALCGATPTGSSGEAWIITFRVIQGAGAALMFPAALAIVVSSFPVSERGRAMALFFGITGGLTSIGPLAGGYLVEIDWRAIFWVNIPVAAIALVLTWISKPANQKHPAPIDYRGAVLISAGMGLAVLGLQESSVWGWGDPRTIGSIVVGLALLVWFTLFELGLANPLIRMQIFAERAFAIDNVILFLLMIPFIPLFFFASIYAQISLGNSASEAGLYLLIFFAGFAIASQVGGNILDKRGARPSVVIGCAVAAIGFALWGHKLTDLSTDAQWPFIVLTGAGVGLILSPANTDALNRAPKASYGEVTGVTQTVRNFGSSLGMAVLGTILIAQNKIQIESAATSAGVPKAQAGAIADQVSQAGTGAGAGGGSLQGHSGPAAEKVLGAIQHGYAESIQTVFYVMAGVMAVAFVIALIAMPSGKVEEVIE